MPLDPLSFGIGFGSGAGLSWLMWRARRRLATIQESAETQIEGTRRFIGQASDARYVRDLMRTLQRRHIAGSLFDLSDVLLEPRLIAPSPPVTPLDAQDIGSRDIFDVVPRFHDMPQSYAPFNVATLSLEDLGSGDRQVAILGLPGMGKSTALTAMALMAMGQVRFESLEDLTEQAIHEEEKDLSDEDRKSRAEERRRIQERAMDKLHDAHQRQREQFTQSAFEDRLPPLDITTLIPILVNLADLELSESTYGRNKGASLDSAEPLIRAAQRQVGGVTARVIGSVLYPALEKGRAMVLIDGYDELSPSLRERYFFWLRQFVTDYRQNLIVIAGPPTGYQPLVNLGFTPVFLRAWQESDYTQLAEHWAKAWTNVHRKAGPLDEQAMRRITSENRGRSILDVVLKVWTGLADDAKDSGRIGWYDAFVTRHLSTGGIRPALPAMATTLLENDQLADRATLESALAEAASAAAENGKPAFKVEGLLDELVKDRLLTTYAGDTFAFVHPHLTSYLASQTLLEPGSERATELALAPEWHDALGFAAPKINILPVIYRKLSVPPDLNYSGLFDLVNWLPDAPVDAPWRGDIFTRLAKAMLAPDQFLTVRERALAALIASRDKNVLFILRQAIRSVDADIRRLGCVGLGALGNPEAIDELSALLADEDQDVKLSAALALGAIGTSPAIEIMIHGLFQESPEVRRAIAEALAALPGEGYNILREAISAKEIEIRRAAVFGLSRVHAPWALVALYRSMLEDEQWYVRTAAEEAFMAAQAADKEGPRAHPEADSLGWLVKWAADQGEGVPAGRNARQVLVRVLQEGQAMYKIMAAQTLSQLGHVEALKPLYGALRDREAAVRVAAYAALFDLQTQLGDSLPGLV